MYSSDPAIRNAIRRLDGAWPTATAQQRLKLVSSLSTACRSLPITLVPSPLILQLCSRLLVPPSALIHIHQPNHQTSTLTNQSGYSEPLVLHICALIVHVCGGLYDPTTSSHVQQSSLPHTHPAVPEANCPDQARTTQHTQPAPSKDGSEPSSTPIASGLASLFLSDLPAKDETLTAASTLYRENNDIHPTHLGLPQTHSALAAAKQASDLYLGDLHLYSNDGDHHHHHHHCHHPRTTDPVALAAIRGTLFSPDVRVDGALVHIVQSLRSLFETEKSLHVRRAALLAFRALLHVVHPDLSAAVLPGFASTLGRFLSQCRHAHSTLAIAAMDALCVHLLRVLATPGSNTSSAISSICKQASMDSVIAGLRVLATTHHDPHLSDQVARTQATSATSAPADVSASILTPFSGQKTPMSDKPVFRQARTDKWRTEATKNVGTFLVAILSSKDGPYYHASVRTRRKLAFFCGALVSCRLFLDSTSVLALVSTLMALRIDESELVAGVAVTQVATALYFQGITFDLIQNGIHTSMALALPPNFECDNRVAANGGGSNAESSAPGNSGLHLVATGDDDQRWLAELVGYVETLCLNPCLSHHSFVPSQPTYGMASDGITEPHNFKYSLLDVLALLDPEYIAEVLIRAFEVNHKITQVVLSPQAGKSELSSPVRLCRLVGASGALSLLHPPLLAISVPPSWQSDDTYLSRTNENESLNLPRRGRALLTLEAIIMGAFGCDSRKRLSSLESASAERSESACPRTTVHTTSSITDQAETCALELLEALSNFRFEDDDIFQNGGVFIDNESLQAKLNSLESIQRVILALSTLHDYLSEDYVLTVIVGLLRDCGSRSSELSTEAEKTMHLVACKYGQMSERELLGRFLNFVMSYVLRHLHEPWSVSALRIIIGSENDNVRHEAITMIESAIISECDDLAVATEFRVLSSLGVIQVVLGAGVNQGLSQLLETVRRKPRVNKNAATCNHLAKYLMTFCTDDTESEHDPDLNSESKLPESAREPGSEHDQLRVGGGSHQQFSEKMDCFPLERLASKALEGCIDLLVGRSLTVRAAALKCATVAVQLLSRNENVLLPHVASLLPLLPDQFVSTKPSTGRTLEQRVRMKRRTQSEFARACVVIDTVNAMSGTLQVISAAAHLLSVLVFSAQDFIKDRFVRLIFPSLEIFLELGGVCTTLSFADVNSADSVPVPSHAALLAVDAALVAVAAVAVEVPSALDSFTQRLAKYLFPFLFCWCSNSGILDKTSHIEQRCRKISGSTRRFGNRARDRYEAEQFENRSELAKIIVGGILKSKPDETWFYMLQYDPSRQLVFSKPHAELHDI